MPTEVIYARVPAELKEVVEGHAASRGVTMAAAVSDLLERGVEAVHDAGSVSALHKQIADLKQQLMEVRASLNEEILQRERAEQQHQLLQRAAQTWSTRANQTVGQCPSCNGVISGYDLFVGGQCPSCEHAITSMLASDEKTGLDQKELLILLGAVGLLLGFVALGRGK